MMMTRIATSDAFTIVPSLVADHKVTRNNNLAIFSSSTSDNSNTLPSNDNDDLQVLRLQDPESGRPIILVGCMHYNPVSIQKSQRIVQELASQQKLYAVLVESCPSRWSKATEFYQQLESTSKLGKRIFDVVLPNEMRAAANIAQQYECPVVLGDQNIELTGTRVKQCFQNTLRDLVQIPNGWMDIGSDVSNSFQILLQSFGLKNIDNNNNNNNNNKSQLSLYPDYFDWALMASMPFSFVRYPLGIALRNPLFFGGIVAVLTLLDQTPSALWNVVLMMTSSTGVDTATAAATDTFMTTSTALPPDVSILSLLLDDSNPLSWIATFMVAALEVLIFGRVLAMPILAERDVVLAQSILSIANYNSDDQIDAVRALDTTEDSEKEQGQLMMAKGEDIIPYVISSAASDTTNNNNAKDQAIVAILGMAHCNGVKKIILEQV